MKYRVAIFISMSLMLTAVVWNTSSNRGTMMPMAVAATRRVSNGQIIQINGDVQLKRSLGRIIRPTIGTQVYPGDELLTARGAQVLVQCADLKMWSVEAGENRLNSCLEATEEAECTPGTYKCPHRGDDIAWNNASIPYVISPRRTALLNDKPTLRWNPVAGETNYTVSIEGEGVNWTTQVSSPQVIYSGESPLKPGSSYLLMVKANSTGVSSLDEPVRPGGLNFSLLGENQAQLVRAAKEQIEQQKWTDQAKALALAHLYTKNDLISEAITTLEELVQSGVQTAPIYRTLGDLYLNYLALVPQARDYYSKAVELASSNNLEERTAAQDGLGQVQKALGNKDEAVRWLTQARDGYKSLGDSERASALEKQLKELVY